MQTEPLVSDIMDKSFTTIRDTDSVNKAIKILMKRGLMGLLVLNSKDELVGKMSEKDCLHVFVHQTYQALPSGTVKDYMKKIETTVSSSMSAKEVANLFLSTTTRRFPVVDSGKLVGQITRRDLLRGLHLYFFPEG